MSDVMDDSRGHVAHDRRVLAFIAALSFGAIGIALVSQHVFDMQPCAWCVLQRLIYAAIGVVALIAALWPRHAARVAAHRTAALGAVMLATLGAASALWQQLFASKSTSCVMTAADQIMGFTRLDTWLPEIFQARASCAEASVRMLGVPYAVWSLLLFLMLAVGALRLHLELRHRGPPSGTTFDGVAA
jgi:protein dithiol:quinone oxidoreductase